MTERTINMRPILDAQKWARHALNNDLMFQELVNAAELGPEVVEKARARVEKGQVAMDAADQSVADTHKR